jgi:hypothetical protein
VIRLALTGLLPCSLAWLLMRRRFGARLRGSEPAALLLDGGPVLIGFLLLLAATARPLLSAVPIAAAAAGLAMVDAVKRATLREPLVFADRAELLEVVRHPRLYLPYAGTSFVLAGTAAAASAFAALGGLEPPLWGRSWAAATLAWPTAALAAAACFVIPARPPMLGVLARLYARARPSRDPATDLARFGPLACVVMHATLARAERPRRRAAAASRPPAGFALRGPVVIVQSESFFDVRRLHPSLADAVPCFARLCRQAAAHGRLDVPAWGANTVRTEFAALTGLDEAAIGLDRFNPYEAFARERVASAAWQAKAAGRRTICVHPFALDFYARRRVLPALGFDELIGPERFEDAPRAGEWVSDEAVGQVLAELIAEHGAELFVFAITMECHGPFDRDDRETAAPALLELLDPRDAIELARYLRRLRGADALLGVVTEALAARGGPGWLAFYGDHQPSLPRCFDRLGLLDPRTDHLLWSAQGGGGLRRDLAAHTLWAALHEAAAPALRAVPA